MYFNIPQCMKCQHSSGANSANVHIACGPFFELDYDESIQRAKAMFLEIYPNDEFLPRAPDPEEIIIEGDAAPDNDGALLADIDNAQSSDASNLPLEDNICDAATADSMNESGNDACVDSPSSDAGGCGSDD